MSRNRQAPFAWLKYIDNHFINGNTVTFQRAWSDHFYLSCQLRLYPSADASSTSTVGRGLWRAHPLLATDSTFRRQLHRALSGRVLTPDPTLSAAQKWEELKRTTATVPKHFSRRKTSTLKRAEALLHKKNLAFSSNCLRILLCNRFSLHNCPLWRLSLPPSSNTMLKHGL
ncbi:hypothetical protein [Parasitella parasitica]|uniref:Uncharacterized protein n=1 Tax=Parasitella parasitica TaxID=35722 RepID=A0A0B7N1U8_9FUNG|nr:hypothetical protein [Parasitella parasitica]